MKPSLSVIRLYRRSRHALPATILVLLAALFAGRPGSPALASCGGVTLVGDTTELNDAIDDFNSQVGPCDYTIEFENDITLTDSTHVIDNDAGVSLLVDGAGFTLDGSFSFETFQVFDTEDVTFRDITVINSDVDGIRVDYGNVRIERTTIRNAGSDAVEFFAGDLVIVDSTLANSDDDGIDAYGGIPNIIIINSTIAGNGDTGLYQNDATSTLIHVTIANNYRGIEIEEGTATINNSILADNVENCREFVGGTADINFSLLNSTDDACGATDGVDGNILGDAAHLLPLGDYGGPTPTIPPLELTGSVTLVSPAIDNGSNALSVDETAATLTTDQRGTGFPRELNSVVDMGAVEGAEVITCPTFPATVVDELELFTAILCYNQVTILGSYTIELGADIDLTSSPPVIDNNEAGVSLVIEGQNFKIDGQDIFGVRPITIAPDTTVTINDAWITRGNVPGDGGGIFNEGYLELNDSHVDENTSEDDGGGIFNEDDATMLINNSTVNGNRAVYPSGDGGGISNDGEMTITDSDVSGNNADGDYFAIGGGILNEGIMTIVRSTIGSNTVTVNYEEGLGGGIANQANLLIRDSAIVNNSVTAEFFAVGGGIFSEADPEEVVYEGYGTQLFIINSTISGNSAAAENEVFGGGLYATDFRFDCCFDPVPVTLVNVTLAGNLLHSYDGSDFGGGGAYFDLSDPDNGLNLVIHNSILADNTTDGTPGGDCVRETHPDLTFEAFNSLYEDTDGGACELAAANPDGNGNIVGVDPILGPLANNGGPTLTHLPDDLSEAIDAGDDSLANDEVGSPLPSDQRGFTPRIVGAAVDMGAVEVGAVGPVAGIFMSATLPGVTDDSVAYGMEDILQWDDGDWSLFFDGSAAGLFPTGKWKHNINAFHIDGGGNIVMSFTQNARFVPGIVPKVDGMDLVRWDGSAFTLWFDGSDVGLTNKTQEKIDGLHILPGSESPIAGGCVAYLLVSTQGPGRVPAYGGGQIRFGGEDVLGFCMTNAGAATAGVWHLVLDGSAEGMPKNATDSISFSPDGDTMYLTTKKGFNVDAAAGGHSMIYKYEFGPNSFSGPFFDAAAEGLPGTVDGLQVEGDLD